MCVILQTLLKIGATNFCRNIIQAHLGLLFIIFEHNYDLKQFSFVVTYVCEYTLKLEAILARDFFLFY